jgi:hypothetical protein
MTAKSLDKADDRLRRALADAKPEDEDVSALFVLRADPVRHPPRAAGSDKRAWQQEAAAAQRNAATTKSAEFLSELRSRGMHVRGGSPGRVAVVRGRPAQIVSALDADLVEHASLDGLMDDDAESPAGDEPFWLELHDVEFGPASPVHLTVRGIQPAHKALMLVAAVDPTEADCTPPGSGILSVEGTGNMPLQVDPYDRPIYLRDVAPNQRVRLIRLYAMDGRKPVPVHTLGISGVSPS